MRTIKIYLYHVNYQNLNFLNTSRDYKCYPKIIKYIILINLTTIRLIYFQITLLQLDILRTNQF